MSHVKKVRTEGEKKMGNELVRGIVAFASGGLLAFSVIVFVQYLIGLILRGKIYARLSKNSERYTVTAKKELYNQKMESFAYAVNGLSEAFFAMSQPKQKTSAEEVGILEQELTGKLCACCDSCAWNR